MSREKAEELFLAALGRGILKKAVFSKAADKATQKEVVTLKRRGDKTVVFFERFTADNKAFHKNDDRSFDIIASELADMAVSSYRQVNIITTAGDVEIKSSKSGSVHIGGKFSDGGAAAEVTADTKKYLLYTSRDIAFLRELGISDPSGRIHDKKQAKFRQINRFLEIVRDVEDKLVSDRPAVIYDLCCGKSYLTFAVYYYFTEIKKMPVKMYGVDLKADVIDYCNDVAKRVGFDDLLFVSGNINEYVPPEPADMVISLHACDIATDIVLANAVKWGAKVILSTPCCHHELSAQLDVTKENTPLKDELSFILDHPMLKQKLCDAVTDALRVKRLESLGYSVTTLELIDPEETPKNLMIRAFLNPRMSAAAKDNAFRSYKQLTGALGVEPFLDRLVSDYEK